jgi:hypothetical protein
MNECECHRCQFWMSSGFVIQTLLSLVNPRLYTIVGCKGSTHSPANVTTTAVANLPNF